MVVYVIRKKRISNYPSVNITPFSDRSLNQPTFTPST